jgi:hypothetical protein
LDDFWGQRAAFAAVPLDHFPYRNRLNSKRIDDARNPDNEPTKKSFAYDFEGKFARFESSDVSASTDPAYERTATPRATIVATKGRLNVTPRPAIVRLHNQ